MLRDKSLIPLSHQHQHALAICVRIERAQPISERDLAAWQAEVAQLFQAEIQVHFAAEEQVLFPAANEFTELRELVGELRSDHDWLRARFGQVVENKFTAKDLADVAGRLSAHIRKEERRLFEGLQKRMHPEQLAAIGEKLNRALQGANQACILPTEATRLRPSK